MRSRYIAWRASAKQRNIPIELTLQQWCGIWAPYWPDRLRADLVLARKYDLGPYAVGNVYITTRAQNCKDHHLHRRPPARQPWDVPVG